MEAFMIVVFELCLVFIFILFLFGVVLSIALGALIVSIKSLFYLLLLFLPALLVGAYVIYRQDRRWDRPFVGKTLAVCAGIEFVVLMVYVQMPVSAKSVLTYSQASSVSLQTTNSFADLTYYGGALEEFFEELNQAGIHRKYAVPVDSLYGDPGDTRLRILVYDEQNNNTLIVRIYESGDISVHDTESDTNTFYVLRDKDDEHVKSIIKTLRQRYNQLQEEKAGQAEDESA